MRNASAVNSEHSGKFIKKIIKTIFREFSDLQQIKQPLLLSMVRGLHCKTIEITIKSKVFLQNSNSF